MRARSAGFTLVEVLVGLLILSFVITTSLLVFFERERRLQYAEETVLVWQSLANEAEVRRFVPWSQLVPGQTTPFVSDLSLLDPLGDAEATVEIEQKAPGVRILHLRIRWRDGLRKQGLEVVRTDTGGGNLW